MTEFTLTAFLVAQASAIAPGAEVRALTVTVVAEDGRPVGGLVREDVTLLENGEARDVTSVEPDRRPLSVAVIVDSSTGVVYRPNLADAVAHFVFQLPRGTSYAVWTTGDRPLKVLDYTEDPAAARGVLERIAQLGPNFMIDALAEASKDLRKTAREADRTAVVAVTGSGRAASYRHRRQGVKSAEKNADLYLALKIDAMGAATGAWDVDYVLKNLTKGSGGPYKHALTYGEVDARLLELNYCLRAGYRLAYATVPDLKKRKIEVRVAQPGMKVLVPACTERQSELAARP